MNFPAAPESIGAFAGTDRQGVVTITLICVRQKEVAGCTILTMGKGGQTGQVAIM